MRKATAILARQAVSTARLRLILARAVLRAAGPETSDEAAVAALVDPVIARLEDAGLLDDAAFARARLARLAAKGRPAAVIRADLHHRHGIAATDDADLTARLSGLDPAVQARRWAERRRLGPFRLRGRADKREADIASLVRAGFPVSVALSVVDGRLESGEQDPVSQTDEEEQPRPAPDVRGSSPRD